MRKLIILLAFIAGCGEPAWKAELAAQCSGWMSRARSASDSLNVEMNCASIHASHEAKDAADEASTMSAVAVGMASSSASARR